MKTDFEIRQHIAETLAGAIKMQADLSERMDRSEKRAEEAHREIMQEFRQNRKEHQAFMAKLNES